MVFFAYRFCGFSKATGLPLEQQSQATTLLLSVKTNAKAKLQTSVKLLNHRVHEQAAHYRRVWLEVVCWVPLHARVVQCHVTLLI
jgi:hypothetical protein